MIDLLEVLDDQDDVDQVYANFESPSRCLKGSPLRGAVGGGRRCPAGPARPRSVLGVSWRSWPAVTAMRRPGREGFVEHGKYVTKVGLP